MKRKSLSASLGSWYVQLAYTPRRAEETARPVERAKSPVAGSGTAVRPWSLLMPAFMALALGAGAGCYALAHFISFGSWAGYLVGALLVAIAVASGACCGGPWVSRFCKIIRWPLVLSILGLAASAQFNSILPSEAEGESNTVVALLVGLVTILSVLLVGARSGGRSVPLSAPLVPCLSLFGLLCLISVDTTIQICFVIFVAAALYLLSYDRFLRLYAPELATGIAFAAPFPLSSDLGESTPTRNECWRWARQSLVVCSVWFALFMLGGVLFYLPVEAVLPRLVSPQLNRMRAATQGLLLDYRGSATVMELRGGDYTLSDRQIMRITVNGGEPSGLWRGRTYEHYGRSRWEEAGIATFSPFADPSRSSYGYYDPSRFEDFRSGRFRGDGMSDNPWRGRRFRERSYRTNQVRNSFRDSTPRYHSVNENLGWPRRNKKKPNLDAKLGRVDEVLEYVEPLEIGPSVVYASGEPISWRERPETTDFWGSSGDGSDGAQSRTPYLIRSYVVRPRIVALQDAVGYEKKPLKESTEQNRVLNHILQRNLQLPEDQATRKMLNAIAAQIRMSQKRSPRTPYEKVRAISNYLTANCLYSLHSPTVPATKDAVTFFLTDSRQGACDMFSSSMALLLRQMNVPARVATGYLQPETPIPAANGEPATSQRPTWLVRERDAHAWVEYYIPGMGWLSYDPTAGTRTAESLPYHIGQLLDLPKLNLPTTFAILPALALFLLLLGAAWPRLESRFRDQSAPDPDALARRRIVNAYWQAKHRMRRRVPLEEHLTPHEYEARVSHSRLPLGVKQEFAALTHLYIAARYGTVPPVSEEELDSCVARLQRAMKGK